MDSQFNISDHGSTVSSGDVSLKVRHSIMLLFCSLLWGTTFVAQDIAMENLGPFTYNACRFFLGALFLLPLAILGGRKDPNSINYRGENNSYPLQERRRNFLKAAFIVGNCMFWAGSFQQIGIMYTTAGKCGFVTALYIVLVPLFGYFIFHRKCSPLVYVAIFVAVIGFYLLCIKEDLSVNRGDLITLAGAVIYAFHILSVDYFSPRICPYQLSCAQLVFSGALSLVAALLFETSSWQAILSSFGSIAYAGILSAGVAYTLQIVGQRGLNPTAASLIMSLESVISAISGWLVLGDTFTHKELAGCILVFCGVILAQLPAPGLQARSRTSSE